LSALEGEALQFAWLIAFPNMVDVTRLDGNGDPVTGLFLTDAETDITLNTTAYPNTNFVSAGDMLRLPGIVRERGIKLQGYSFTLAGASQQNAVRFEAANMTGQICDILLVLLNADGSIISGEAINLYRGTFHTWQERDSGGSSTVTVSLTSPWSQPNLTAGRITSDNNQQERYAGDNFFKFAHRKRENIGWGGES